MSLHAKTIVVTGAASGIGAATVSELKNQGAIVIGVDRTPIPDLNQSFVADLGDQASIDRLISALPDGIDGLANIAGLPPTAPPGDVIRVNLRGLQRLTLGLIPKFTNGGAIVNLVSSAANRWTQLVDLIKEFETVSWDDIDSFATKHDLGSDGASYFFAKASLLVWTMQNGATWLDRGIRINAVSPGPIDTPILADFIETLGSRAQRSINSTERLGTPADVAPIVAFMLSDGSTWFRGADVRPDGGLSAFMQLEEHGLN